MQLVVTGASSVLGQALLRALAARGALTSGVLGFPVPLQRIIAVDRSQPPALFLDERVEYVRGDYEQPRFLARMMGVSTDSVFHLASLGASAGLERVGDSLDAALTRSVETTRALLEACRFQGAAPRLVQASAPAAPGADGRAADGLAVACELIAVEAAHFGVVDARCVRLPCVVGNASSAAALALDERLALVAAGHAPGDACTELDVLLPDEAAAALIGAHERPRLPLFAAQFVDVHGRRPRLSDLVAQAGVA